MSTERRQGFRRAGDHPHAKVLVLEDDPALRGVLADRLAGAGYIVCTAKRLDEALAMPGDFDVLVLDQHLPNGKGVRAGARWPHALCLVISGHDRPEGMPDGYGFLPKPFSMSTMLEWIGSGLAAQERA